LAFIVSAIIPLLRPTYTIQDFNTSHPHQRTPLTYPQVDLLAVTAALDTILGNPRSFKKLADELLISMRAERHARVLVAHPSSSKSALASVVGQLARPLLPQNATTSSERLNFILYLAAYKEPSGFIPFP
jgi:hypothetical protein